MTQDAMVPFRKYLRRSFHRRLEAIDPQNGDDLQHIIRCFGEFDLAREVLGLEESLPWDPLFQSVVRMFRDMEAAPCIIEGRERQELEWLRKSGRKHFADALAPLLREEP